MENWKAQAERLDKLDTCAVSDAMDRLGLKGAVIGIRPMWDCPRIAGRVITVKIAPAGPTPPEHHLATPAVASAESGEVIVVDNAGRTDVSCWGDILSNASQVKGIHGVIIDGASRDVDGSREIGFPVFARNPVPVTARGRVVQEAYNTPIQCGGILVRPGDLVIADGSGVVFLPQERAEEIITSAEKIALAQADMVRAVRAGYSVVDVMAERQFEAIHK